MPSVGAKIVENLEDKAALGMGGHQIGSLVQDVPRGCQTPVVGDGQQEAGDDEPTSIIAVCEMK